MDIKDKEQVFVDWIARMRRRAQQLEDMLFTIEVGGAENFSVYELTRLRLEISDRIWKLEDEIASAESSLQPIRDMRDVIETLSTMGDPKDQPS